MGKINFTSNNRHACGSFTKILILVIVGVISSGCVQQAEKQSTSSSETPLTSSSTDIAPPQTLTSSLELAVLSSDFTPPTGKTTRPGAEGPWVYRLMSATSTDGLNFTRTNEVITDQGDVPDLVQDSKGWLYLYYTGWTVGNETNKTVVAISQDKGVTWAFKKLHLTGFNGTGEPVDPDVQILPDGTFRLYVTYKDFSNPNENPSTHYAEGIDGINFTYKGVAFSQPGKNILDPTVIHCGSSWQLFARGNLTDRDANWYAVSEDGKTFTFVEEKNFIKDGKNRTMGNGITVSGGCRFYAHGGAPEISSFFSTDSITWTADPGSRLTLDTTTGKETKIIKEPAVVQLSDGTYFMVYVVEIP